MNLDLTIWTVYYHPRDYPDKWVARKWLVRSKYSQNQGRPEATAELIIRENLAEIRDAMAARGLTYMPRFGSDDAAIFEVWI